jgi:hypothetical protein
MSFLENKKLCMQAQVIFKINSIYENSNMIEINILEFKMHDSYNRRVLALLGKREKRVGQGEETSPSVTEGNPLGQPRKKGKAVPHDSENYQISLV